LYHYSDNSNKTAILPKFVMYAKWPAIYFETSVLSIQCLHDFINYFKPTGWIPYLHFFSNNSKTESLPVYIFVIDKGNEHFSKI